MHPGVAGIRIIIARITSSACLLYVCPRRPGFRPCVCCRARCCARGHADSCQRKVLLPGCRGWSPAGTNSFLSGLCLALETELISVWPWGPPFAGCCARFCARGHADSCPRKNIFLRAEARARQGRTHSCKGLGGRNWGRLCVDFRPSGPVPQLSQSYYPALYEAFFCLQKTCGGCRYAVTSMLQHSTHEDG